MRHRPTIERVIEFEGVEYHVDMNWRPDEPAAGLREGWEECTVTQYLRAAPSLYVCVGFVPDYGCPVQDWAIEGMSLIGESYGNHPRATEVTPWAMMDADSVEYGPYRQEKVPAKLGWFYGFYQAVDEVWTEALANEEEANRKLEEQLAEIALADYERRMEP
jgi:hypothetical protein